MADIEMGGEGPPPLEENGQQHAEIEEQIALEYDQDNIQKEDLVSKQIEDGSDDEEGNLFGSDDDDEEDNVQVTIQKYDPINVPFTKPTASSANLANKLDIDHVPLIGDKPIYDIDLAQMDDRPWRKPGADITDYFNYGFTEDTWNTYCERQKKLRTEFGGNQAHANRALFSSITLANPLAMPKSVTEGSTGAVKVLTDNGGRFKPHQFKGGVDLHDHREPIVRTVIGTRPLAASSSSTSSVGPPGVTPSSSSAPLMDFSKPPPNLSGLVSISTVQQQQQQPPPALNQPPPMSQGPPSAGLTSTSQPPSAAAGMAASTVQESLSSLRSDAPPGVDCPPGVEEHVTTPVSSAPSQGIPTLGGPPPNMSMPPPGFNPALPPPMMRAPPPTMMSAPPTSMPPPPFNVMLPPPGFPPGMAPPGTTGGSTSQRYHPPPLSSRSGLLVPPGTGGSDFDSYSSRRDTDYDDGFSDDRKRSTYKRRSRSRSPSKRDSGRRRDRDREDRDRESRSSRRHRSRSRSGTPSESRSSKKDKKRDRRAGGVDEDDGGRKRRHHRDEERESGSSSSRSRKRKGDDADEFIGSGEGPPGVD